MAKPTSTMQNMFPPKADWSTDKIPDLFDRVMIVTGGYSGIGKETVLVCRHDILCDFRGFTSVSQELLKHNAKVYIAGRSKQKADAAIEQFKKETGQTPEFITLDLSDLQSVKAAAADFQSYVFPSPLIFDSCYIHE